MKQGTGIIKFFLVILTLVCLLQYFYMLPTRKIEKSAETYANNLAQQSTAEDADAVKKIARTQYLDSVSNEVVFSIPLFKDFTYQELKESQLAFGLDLVGGMSVVLQVDLRDFIRSLSNSSKDPTFLAALEKAAEDQKGAQSDYVTLFADAFQELGVADKRLAPIFLTNETFRDDIDFNTPDAEVVRLLREKANETVSLTFQRLRDRIDELGVVQPNVSLDAARDLIIVELPGISNPERARNFLQSTAKLEFWKVYRVSDPGILAAFQTADDRISKMGSGIEEDSDASDQDFTVSERWEYTGYDEDGNVTDSTLVRDTLFSTPELAAGGPLLSKLKLNGLLGQLSYPQSVMGVVQKNQVDDVQAYLDRPEIKSLFPADISFKWSYKPSDFVSEEEQRKQYYELYAIKNVGNSDVAPLAGDRVTRASADPDPTTGEIGVSLSMDAMGANIWRSITTEAAQDNQREVAIVLDEKVVSAPSVRVPIENGRSSITGGFSLQEAEDLSKILQIGKLPARTEIIQEALVGPSLGAQNINTSITSILIGFGAVFIFMILYYGTGGIVSIIALLMNLFFIFGSLASIGTVLTLPGIAGIILTIGMAVDANVIIYERIREELREGKSLLASIGDGFKNSYSAIIDANVTTILTAFVLAYFGLGPIKGFAVVLIIGVLCSIFTAVLVGRLMIDWWTDSKGNQLSFWTGMSKNSFAHMKFDWLGKRKMAYVFSAIIIVSGIISMSTRGFDLGVDFKGGYSYNIEFDRDMDAETLRTGLADALGSTPSVKSVSTGNTFNVVTDFMIDNSEDDAADKVMQALYTGVNGIAGGDINLDSFKDPDGKGTHVSSSSKVGPTIADDIQRSSVWAATFALLLIFLYIFIRFSKWQYSLGAVAALFHDV
ncbi:MAG: protein translocase subunit SecD, partial [Saprospiraceae bacterium]|nr:protein translocase subunit SecD [Saprospiraceae bacterium]